MVSFHIVLNILHSSVTYLLIIKAQIKLGRTDA